MANIDDTDPPLLRARAARAAKAAAATGAMCAFLNSEDGRTTRARITRDNVVYRPEFESAFGDWCKAAGITEPKWEDRHYKEVLAWHGLLISECARRPCISITDGRDHFPLGDFLKGGTVELSISASMTLDEFVAAYNASGRQTWKPELARSFVAYGITEENGFLLGVGPKPEGTAPRIEDPMGAFLASDAVELRPNAVVPEKVFRAAFSKWCKDRNVPEPRWGKFASAFRRHKVSWSKGLINYDYKGLRRISVAIKGVDVLGNFSDFDDFVEYGQGPSTANPTKKPRTQ